MSGRISICYAAPGQNLLSTAGSARNVLSAAEAMSEWADVTVAFRRLSEPAPDSRFRVVSIEEPGPESSANDDVAVRGLNPLVHARYLRTLRRFAAESVGKYDVILEKGWRFSGYLAVAALRHGISSALIENDVRYTPPGERGLKSIVRRAAQSLTQAIAARCSRNVPLVIAETEELRDALVALRGLRSDRIEVVELGVDHALFHPRELSLARQRLGIKQTATALVYVGGLDIYHDLGPLIEALGHEQPAGVELHVVGDGELRGEYEGLARRLGVSAIFHGKVPHGSVPVYIAAGDLCLAPYQPSRFYGGKIAFSTLKIPEYMACARAVASVPKGHITRLIEPGVNGFLLDNDSAAWREFLRQLPPRTRLAEMGRRGVATAAKLSWDRTAARYVELARGLVPEPRPALRVAH